MDDRKLNDLIHKRFDNVLNWRYNNSNKNSVVITFKDGSEAVYTINKVKKEDKVENNENIGCVMEALTEEDVEELSTFSFTDEELSHVLSLFELISDDNKDKAFDIIKALFKNKKLVPDDTASTESIIVKHNKNAVSERYVKKLLGDI